MWPLFRIETLIFLIDTMLRRAKCKRVCEQLRGKKVDKNSSLVRRFSYVSEDIIREKQTGREKEKDNDDDDDDDDDSDDDDSDESGVEKKTTTKSGFCRL